MLGMGQLPRKSTLLKVCSGAPRGGGCGAKAGIAEILYEQRPRIRLADEIDKFENKDIAILLSLAETGIVRETKISKQREVRLNTNIFAAANSTRGMPKELLFRFKVLYLPEYTREKV